MLENKRHLTDPMICAIYILKTVDCIYAFSALLNDHFLSLGGALR